MSGFLDAAQFLTRVPIRTRRPPDLTRSVPWFPVVGGAVGAAVGGVVAGLSHLVPMTVAAAVGVVFGVLVTGAFHEDGLADVADAFVGGWDVEQRVRLLDDPRHGSYGVAALSGSLVIRIVAVASMGPASAFAALVAAHALARGAAVGAMGIAPSASTRGLGADYARSVGAARAGLGVLAALIIAVAATGWWALPFAGAVGAAAILVSWWAIRKIGGISGDVLGAIEQVAEILALVVASGLAARWTPWWS